LYGTKINNFQYGEIERRANRFTGSGGVNLNMIDISSNKLDKSLPNINDLEE